MTEEPISILIADDYPLSLAGLRHALAADPSVAVVAECLDGEEAMVVNSDNKCNF